MDLTVNGEDKAATGKVYETDKVRLIGKTGTAQYTTSTGEYTSGTNNIRSFAGIFPKQNPEYIIYCLGGNKIEGLGFHNNHRRDGSCYQCFVGDRQ